MIECTSIVLVLYYDTWLTTTSSHVYYTTVIRNESYLNKGVSRVNFPQHEITRKIDAIVPAVTAFC